MGSDAGDKQIAMSKSPAFQFYVKDWLTDTRLIFASKSTKGIWIDILCLMWISEIKGEIEFNSEAEFCRILMCSKDEFNLFFEEAQALRFCYIVTGNNKEITLRNNRMYREQKEKNNNRLRQQRYREKQKSNSNITPLSPTPSPTPKKKTSKKKNTFYPDWLDLKLWKEFKKMRTKIKKPMTELAEKRLIEKLNQIIKAGYSQETTIENSIQNCWQSFYEPKNETPKFEEDESDKKLKAWREQQARN